MARIGIDLDGVCYPFVEELSKHALTLGHTEESMPMDFEESWSVEDAWGWTNGEYDVVIRSALEARTVWFEGEPSRGCADALGILRHLGHTVSIVTHRAVPGYEDACREATEHWLATNAIPHDDLIIVRNKTGLDIDVLLDDAPHNADAHIAAGERIVIWDQPYNRQPRFDAIERADSWESFTALVILDRTLRAA